MTTSLQGIARKARHNKKHRFRNLYGMLTKQFMRESWSELNRAAAPGYDRISARDYGRSLNENIEDLVVRLKEKRYRAANDAGYAGIAHRVWFSSWQFRRDNPIVAGAEIADENDFGSVENHKSLLDTPEEFTTAAYFRRLR